MPLSSIVLPPEEVESVPKILPVRKASGPDGLSNKFLRDLSKELASPCCPLFNQSTYMGIVPLSYKEAKNTPVPPTGGLSLATNYRPISLLNSEAK